METVLITGTSKGIGLEFAKQYTSKGCRVYGTYRGQPSQSLEALNAEAKNFSLVKCDLGSLAEIDQLAESLADTPLDTIISNAGVMGRGGPPGAPNGEQIGELDYDLFDLYMSVNVRAPAKLAERLRDNLKEGASPKFVAISSGAGSFGMTATLPGNYWYKSSKAALNMVMRNIAVDLKLAGVTVLTLHPGLVLTERLAPMRDKILSMPTQEKAFEPQEAVANMIKAISAATIDDTGRFIRNDGTTMPW